MDWSYAWASFLNVQNVFYLLLHVVNINIFLLLIVIFTLERHRLCDCCWFQSCVFIDQRQIDACVEVAVLAHAHRYVHTEHLVHSPYLLTMPGDIAVFHKTLNVVQWLFSVRPLGKVGWWPLCLILQGRRVLHVNSNDCLQWRLLAGASSCLGM